PATPAVESGNGPEPSEIAIREPVVTPAPMPAQPPVPVVEPVVRVEPIDRDEPVPAESRAPEEPSAGPQSGEFVRRKRRVARGGPKR
ncbi:MAG: hypothetical protein ACRDGR_10760, partial [bacterium]